MRGNAADSDMQIKNNSAGSDLFRLSEICPKSDKQGATRVRGESFQNQLARDGDDDGCGCG
jgi:hypothetical protein